ncbi:MAG: hypothetical protein QM613_03775 [Micrococcaceae bacterium]
MFYALMTLILTPRYGYNNLTVFNVFIFGVATALTVVNIIDERNERK